MVAYLYGELAVTSGSITRHTASHFFSPCLWELESVSAGSANFTTQKNLPEAFCWHKTPWHQKLMADNGSWVILGDLGWEEDGQSLKKQAISGHFLILSGNSPCMRREVFGHQQMSIWPIHARDSYQTKFVCTRPLVAGSEASPQCISTRQICWYKTLGRWCTQDPLCHNNTKNWWQPWVLGGSDLGWSWVRRGKKGSIALAWEKRSLDTSRWTGGVHLTHPRKRILQELQQTWTVALWSKELLLHCKTKIAASKAKVAVPRCRFVDRNRIGTTTNTIYYTRIALVCSDAT